MCHHNILKSLTLKWRAACERIKNADVCLSVWLIALLFLGLSAWDKKLVQSSVCSLLAQKEKKVIKIKDNGPCSILDD